MWVVWFHGWHESNFGMDRVGRVGPQNFSMGQRKWQGRNFGLGETSLYELLLWLYEVLLVILVSLFQKIKNYISF